MLRSFIAIIAIATTVNHVVAAETPPRPRTVEVAGLTVELSPPVLVARSSGYLWFPTLARESNGELLAVMSNYADIHVADGTSETAWSGDGGRTWSALRAAKGGDVPLQLPSGDLLLLPYYLHPAVNGAIMAPYQLAKKGARDLQLIDPGVTVSGWPRPVGSFSPKLGLAGFVFNGSAVKLKDESFLATLYGYFENDKLYSLVAAESRDGVAWRFKTVIADSSCGFKGSGPCESAMCRLKDGRIMCVFRNDGGLPYGQTFSADEGKTWDKPVLMKGVFSVEPALLVTGKGPILLAGGRPGVFVWINRDGTGKDWEPIDILAHHNICQPNEQIIGPERTSSYTELAPLDDASALLIYDRIPHGWHAIAKESTDTNSVWVVRLKLKEKR